LEWQREVSGAEEFLETVKMDLFRDQVFVYTPKGDVKELPAGSTPLDFAYRIHTELGHRCIGAKINGKLVSLTSQLQNGDTVEILASKAERGPSLDWLNPHLGYTKTAGARQAIRAWFRRQAREANVQRGKDLLHRELKRLRLGLKEEEVAQLMRVDTVEELFLALGSGAMSTAQVTARLTEHQKPAEELKVSLPLAGPASGVEVLGVSSLLSHMASCCSPLPGDEIVGYVTRSRGVTIHRTDCKNILNEDEPERLIGVNWGDGGELYPARVRLEAWDRVGLIRDITTVVSGEGLNIASVVTQKREDGAFVMELTIHTTGLAQLSRLFSKLDGVEGFISVARLGRSPQPLRGRGQR
jgi:GTP pyrophosphokinase